MPRRASLLVLTWVTLVGCGARSALLDGEATSESSSASTSTSSSPATTSSSSSSSSGAGGNALCHPGDAPVRLASGLLAHPQRIAVDATFAFITDMGKFSGRVVRVPLAGGDLVELATNLARPSAIALDEKYVYFTDSVAGQVLRLPKEGGAAEQLGPWQHHPEAIVTRPEGIYWLNRGNPNDGAVVFLPSGGVEPTILVGSLHDASQLAVDGDALWWTSDAPGGSLSKAPLDGSPIESFAPVDTPRALALDATHVFLASAGEIRRSNQDAGPLQTLASPAVAQGMAVRGGLLYWASTFKGVDKVPVEGGAVIHVAQDSNVHDVAVDDACVYWIGNGAWRAPK